MSQWFRVFDVTTGKTVEFACSLKWVQLLCRNDRWDYEENWVFYGNQWRSQESVDRIRQHQNDYDRNRRKR